MNLIHYWPLKETISQQTPEVTSFFCLRRYYGMSNLTADIVHGLACFDPHVLASLAMEQVTFCFGSLFQSFCLRGWVQRSSESDYRDEYMEFLDYFRASFPQLTVFLMLTLRASSGQEFSSPGHLILSITATSFTVRYVKQTYLSTSKDPAKHFGTIKLRDTCSEIKGGDMNTSVK